MKKALFTLMLVATCATPVGSASASSDSDREGYWNHHHDGNRDRGNGRHHGWRFGWDHWHHWHGWDHDGGAGGGDTVDTDPPVETVDEATDDHVGEDD